MDQNFVHQQFESRASANPGHTAIDYGTGSVTYQQLSEYSNELSQLLRRLSVSKTDVVGVLLEEGAHRVISILGVFKSSAI